MKKRKNKDWGGTRIQGMRGGTKIITPFQRHSIHLSATGNDPVAKGLAAEGWLFV
ncbi:hypothetical protein [Sphingobacterium mizutaii]|uniref:hypothetical protein n=1 Tax=Sphingobacterium mizutaii TaxID=1010 RepID=UPI0012FD33B8|nr:hypothetical protein [Sphingobacterium mizutaii]